jgi:thiol-disulfide isomerase/thioredoxin
VQEKFSRLATDKRFLKGEKAPSFTLTDASGKTYSLKDLGGKKIYIDVLASWCKPCVEGIPAWNRLVKENRDSNTVFLSVSLDDTEKEWRTFLKRYAIEGKRLFAGNGGFKTPFAVDYNITALPAYILLDEEGKIITPIAPAPGNRNLLNLLSGK